MYLNHIFFKKNQKFNFQYSLCELALLFFNCLQDNRQWMQPTSSIQLYYIVNHPITSLLIKRKHVFINTQARINVKLQLLNLMCYVLMLMFQPRLMTQGCCIYHRFISSPLFKCARAQIMGCEMPLALLNAGFGSFM